MPRCYRPIYKAKHFEYPSRRKRYKYPTKVTSGDEFIHERYKPPKRCDPRSFRVIHIKPGVEGTICCPHGAWNARANRCETGTILQKIMKSKKMIRKGKLRCP